MKRYDNDKVMVFGDLHAPYNADEAIDFLADVKRRFKPDRIVCTGDLVDFYAASRYPKSPDHPDSLLNELKKTQKVMKRLGKLFPKCDVTLGNHDDRMAMKVSGSGIPAVATLSLADIIGTAPGWTLHKSSTNFNLTVNSTREKITFAHHRGANTLLLAQRLGRTFVAGHQHTKGQVVGFNNGYRTFFGVNCPCLISGKGSPFAYTKISNINPVRGCCLIEEGVPRLVMLEDK